MTLKVLRTGKNKMDKVVNVTASKTRVQVSMYPATISTIPESSKQIVSYPQLSYTHYLHVVNIQLHPNSLSVAKFTPPILLLTNIFPMSLVIC